MTTEEQDARIAELEQRLSDIEELLVPTNERHFSRCKERRRKAANPPAPAPVAEAVAETQEMAPVAPEAAPAVEGDAAKEAKPKRSKKPKADVAK